MVRLLPHPLRTPHDSQSSGNKENILLAGVIDPDYQGEIELLLHNGGKKEDVLNPGDPLGYLLVLP